MLVLQEVVLRNRRDLENVFRWDKIRMDLPASKTYDPNLPWVSKIRLEDGMIAADLFIYVNDVRLTGSSSEECGQAERIARSMWQTHLEYRTQQGRGASALNDL